jgi:predicted SAM-dependent methyltransferase
MKPVFGWLNKKQAHAGARLGDLLNLGCGASFHPAWVNVDFHPADATVLRHDLRQTLPFPDGHFAAVYHSHVLEHFPKAFAPVFLRECRRVLRPGGVLRVVVPDLENIARLYLQNLEAALAGDAKAGPRHEWMTLELLDQMTREEGGGEMAKFWSREPMPAEDFVKQRSGAEVLRFLAARKARPESKRNKPAIRQTPARAAHFRESGEIHKWMYDRRSLGLLLEETGLAQARACAASESAIDQFNSYGLDLTADGGIRKPDSLFMEAIKP